MPGQSRSPPPSRRAERSCVMCHRRKVRCNKQSPCAQCARGGYSCVYPQIGPPTRRVRKTTITDVASRITELEKTLIAVSRDHEAQVNFRTHPSTASPSFPQSTPSTDLDDGDRHLGQGEEVLLKKGTSSQYFNEALLSRVIEHEQDVRSALSTPKSHTTQPPPSSPFSPMGILSSKRFDDPLINYLPSKAMSLKLWGVFVDCIDPCSKILHIPTDEIKVYTVIDKPHEASTESLALCFAVYYAATIAVDSSEVSDLLKDEMYERLHRYKYGLEQAFAHSEFLESPTVVLLQALVIYLVALRVHNTGRGIWTLNGLAIRSAQSIGLHRDGRMLNLSPFESEIRRRLWWRLLSLDGRAAEDYGLQNISDHHLVCGVDMPLNVEDVDLYPEMKELPASRPGYTRMTLVLVNIEVARAWSQLLHIASPTGILREPFRSRVAKEATDKMSELISKCNTIVPQQRLTSSVSKFILRKLELVSRQRDIMNDPNQHESLAKEENFLEAIYILIEADSLWCDELLKPFRWTMHAYRQFQMMLYILWYICVRPNDPNASRGLASVESHLKNGRKFDESFSHEPKWMIIMALKEKATTSIAAVKKASRMESEDAPSAPSEGDEMVIWKPGAEGNGDQDSNAAPGILDWRTLLEDFQFDANNILI